MLHHIQKHILNTLAHTNYARYSELKPAELDGNTFTYHLKRMITDNYVFRNDDNTYTLTQRGKTYVVHRNEDPELQAHSIFLIVLRMNDKWLLRERLVQPHLHSVGFIHGEPRYNESVTQTAKRRLLEKTGIITELETRGSALISISNEKELLSYSHAILLYGETTQELLRNVDSTGKNIVASEKDLLTVDILPSVADILKNIDELNNIPELHYTIK